MKNTRYSKKEKKKKQKGGGKILRKLLHRLSQLIESNPQTWLAIIFSIPKTL